MGTGTNGDELGLENQGVSGYADRYQIEGPAVCGFTSRTTSTAGLRSSLVGAADVPTPESDQSRARAGTRRRTACIGCHLIEPEPGTWILWRCPRCAELAARAVEGVQGLIDLTGRVFHRLTVLNYVGKGLWNCRCQCGTFKIADGHKLRRGLIRSCGCLVRDTAWKNLPPDQTGAHNGNFIDLTGRTFERLTVLSYAGKASWNCRCECGSVKVVRGADLKNGMIRSCGCLGKELRRNDLTGQVFGRLTVIGLNCVRDRQCYWTCQCTCGATPIVKGGRLTGGETRSCGCLNRELPVEVRRAMGRKGYRIQRRNALATGRRPRTYARGEQAGNSRLSTDDVRAIRAEFAKGKTTMAKLAGRYGVTESTVWNVVQYKTWKHIEGPPPPLARQLKRWRDA